VYFRQIVDPRSRALTYVLADLLALEAVVVDPWLHAEVLLRAVLAERNLHLRWVLVTTATRPRAAGASALGGYTDAIVVSGDEPSDGRVLAVDGDRIEFGSEFLRAVSTPASRRTSLSYLWRDRLFCGDALDVPAHGGGGPRGIRRDAVLERLAGLPGETLVFPGHARHWRSISTIAEERGRCARHAADGEAVARTSVGSRPAAARCGSILAGEPSCPEGAPCPPTPAPESSPTRSSSPSRPSSC
jgi:sulfur dioxygenase